MALTTTTLSTAVAITDTSIIVASATGFAAGNLVLIDQELMQVLKNYVSGTTIPVLRGLDGTKQVLHRITANVTTYLPSDQAGPLAQEGIQYPMQRGREILSYTTAGAITLPTPGNDMLAILNSTVALAMTLAAPTKDMDGSILTVVGNGKAAHTLSLPAGVGLGAGGSGVDVGTFASGAQQSVVLMAANAVWVPYGSFMGGTSLANVTVTWA